MGLKTIIGSAALLAILSGTLSQNSSAQENGFVVAEEVQCTSRGQTKLAREPVLNYEQQLHNDAIFDLLVGHPDGIKGYKPEYNSDFKDLFQLNRTNRLDEKVRLFIKTNCRFTREEEYAIIEKAKAAEILYNSAEQKEFGIYRRLNARMCGSASSGRRVSEQQYKQIARETIPLPEWEGLSESKKSFYNALIELHGFISGTDYFKRMNEVQRNFLFSNVLITVSNLGYIIEMKKTNPGISSSKAIEGYLEARLELEELKLERRKADYKYRR